MSLRSNVLLSSSLSAFVVYFLHWSVAMSLPSHMLGQARRRAALEPVSRQWETVDDESLCFSSSQRCETGLYAEALPYPRRSGMVALGGHEKKVRYPTTISETPTAGCMLSSKSATHVFFFQVFFCFC